MSKNKNDSGNSSYRSVSIPVIIGPLLRIIIQERDTQLSSLPALQIFKLQIDCELLSKAKKEDSILYAIFSVEHENQTSHKKPIRSKIKKATDQSQMTLKLSLDPNPTPVEERYFFDVMLKNEYYPPDIAGSLKALIEIDSRILSTLSTAQNESNGTGTIYTAHLWWLTILPYSMLNHLQNFYENAAN